MEALKVEKHSRIGQLSLAKDSLLYEPESACQYEHSYRFQFYPEIDMEPPVSIYLPMECLLTRFISLPLQHVSLVDADMMFQELANDCDEDEADWWLSWDLNACDTGVAGMLFGLPEAWRASMQAHATAMQASFVGVDGYERLQVMRTHKQASLVLDHDGEGLFFGVYDGQVWRGMRRINGEISAISWQEILYASAAMGFDLQLHTVQGRAGQALVDSMLLEGMNWQGAVLECLSSRHEANLALHSPSEGSLNFRHGAWGTSQGLSFLKPWKRSGILCGLLFCAWLASTVIDLSRLDNDLFISQQRIEAAFHKGLPNEPVMLDALAQLSKAAGGNDIKNPVFLFALQAMSQVYKKHPWRMSSLELRDGKMYMAGDVKDIKALNKIQSELQHILQGNVRISDTNMNGKHVVFRMQW